MATPASTRQALEMVLDGLGYLARDVFGQESISASGTGT